MRYLKAWKYNGKIVLTIPVEIMRANGWGTGEVLQVDDSGDGRLRLYSKRRHKFLPDQEKWLEKFEKKYFLE